MGLRIGFVGCGHIAAVHAASLHELARIGRIDAAITAVFDPDTERAERFASRYGADVHATIDSAMDVVDVVWVCTWTSAHRAAVEAAAARDLPVFCEKPLGTDLDDCDAVAAALATIPHQVGLVLRWAPVFARVAEIVQSRRHGRTLTAILRDDQFFPIQGYYGSQWRGDVARAGGGTLIEHSIHDIDVLRWILGDPVWVSGVVNTAYGHEGIEDLASLTLGFADGSTAQLVSVWHQILTRGSSRRLEVFCDSAYLWTESDYLGPLHIETADGIEVYTADAPEWAGELAVPEMFQKALAQYAVPNQHFLEALDPAGASADLAGFPTAADALAAHRIVEAAYRSARSGRPTALSDLG
jgi:predicted dehydrogenase